MRCANGIDAATADNLAQTFKTRKTLIVLQYACTANLVAVKIRTLLISRQRQHI